MLANLAMVFSVIEVLAGSSRRSTPVRLVFRAYPHRLSRKISKKPLAIITFGKINFFNPFPSNHLRSQQPKFSPKMGGWRTYGRGRHFFLPQEEALMPVPSRQAVVQPQARIVTRFNRGWRHDPRKTRRKPRRRRHHRMAVIVETDLPPRAQGDAKKMHHRHRRYPRP